MSRGRRASGGSSGRANDAAGNWVTRWRRQRRLLRESRLLRKEARRILRKHQPRMKPELVEQVEQATTAVLEARKAKDYRKLREQAERLDELLSKHLASYRKSVVREYTESIGVAVLIALLLRAFVVEAFKIPSGSMIPTLKIGDHIFVNKFIYGLRIPWTDIKFFQSSPKRGEVVVFVYPLDEDKDFIKRVVAVAGDEVSVSNNIVTINGKPIPRRPLDGECAYDDGDEDAVGEIRPCLAFLEQRPTATYRVIQDVHGFPVDLKPTRIPEGQIFVMGDNRDNSHDSRVWGTVPLSHVKGKAMIIWWSSGGPQGVRWKRFFQLVHGTPTDRDVKP